MSLVDSLTFDCPAALALLALLPLYAWYVTRPGRRAALTFSHIAAVRAAARRRPDYALALRLLALAALIIGCAQPGLTERLTERRREGVDILLALDVSPSMAAVDISPPGLDHTRCDIARSVIDDFISRRPDDRIGLIAFAGKPYLVSPLTLNHTLLRRALTRLRPGLLPEAGTAIGEATAMAVDRLGPRPAQGSRIVILLTDGDDNASEALSPDMAAVLAHSLGVRLHTIGVGDDKPALMPDFDPDTGRVLRTADGRLRGRVMMDPANFTLLARMAKSADGRFHRAKNAAELARIYDDISRLETSPVRIEHRTETRPLTAWPAGLALIALLAEILLAHTRRRLP